MTKTYRINECFYSLQGEGRRAGIPHIFLRFSDCNLRCQKEREGFDCDTEFLSGRDLALPQILDLVKSQSPQAKWILLTGGEPSLQVDEDLIRSLKEAGYKLAIETNGLKELPSQIDWICVSPKTAEHTLRQDFAHEVKYVRAAGMGIPQPKIKAKHYLLSPAFEANRLPAENLDWCIQLVKENPQWALSVQQHKHWQIR